jgi:polar amino acid transport system substrate-binding protein
MLMTQDADRAALNRRALLSRGAALSGAAVAGASLVPAAALAKDEPGDSLLKKVLDRGKVVVGTGSTNPPWHFEDENGKLVGFDIEMGKLLSRGLFQGDDSKVEFVVQEADARIPNLLADKVDVDFQFMTVTTGRAIQVEFTIPYYREGVVLIVLKDSPYNNLKDFDGKKAKIAILQNVTAEDMVHRGVPDAEVQQLDSQAATLEALKAGRVEAAASDKSTGRWLTVNESDTYKVIPEGWDSQTYAGAVKPGDQIWLNYINTVLHEAMTGLDFPLFQAAFKTYFGEDLPNPALGFPMEYK